MSPEQANGKSVDARSDLFSLGCVLYLLCTGVSPFRRASEFDTMLAVTEHAPPSPRDLNPSLPAAAAELVVKLLAKAGPKAVQRPRRGGRARGPGPPATTPRAGRGGGSPGSSPAPRRRPSRPRRSPSSRALGAATRNPTTLMRPKGSNRKTGSATAGLRARAARPGRWTRRSASGWPACRPASRSRWSRPN